MRLKLAAIVMLGLPVVAAAQPAPVAGGVVPLPPIGLPLPQIGLPHPPTGLPVAEASQVHRPANRPAVRTKAPHRPGGALVPIYGWPYLYEVPVMSASPAPQSDSRPRPVQPPVGTLQLDVAAAAGGEQQLYVDGYYVGTVVDFASGVELEAGPHAIEIREAGFETLGVAVNIAPGRAITYRGSMKATDSTLAPAVSGASSQPVTPPAPMIGYIVPGCYIGNVPPQDAGLPPTCDLSRVITIKR